MTFVKRGMGIVGGLILVSALALPAFATPVPEIDAGTATSAIALLVGGSFIAISKLRRK